MGPVEDFLEEMKFPNNPQKMHSLTFQAVPNGSVLEGVNSPSFRGFIGTLTGRCWYTGVLGIPTKLFFIGCFFFKP